MSRDHPLLTAPLFQHDDMSCDFFFQHLNHCHLRLSSDREGRSRRDGGPLLWLLLPFSGPGPNGRKTLRALRHGSALLAMAAW